MPFKKNMILCFFTVLMITGCGGGEETSQDNRFADLPEYNLEQVQRLEDQGDLILGRPVYTEIDSDGNHLVMDLASFEVYVFDSEGTYLTSFGSEGEGPGEFQQPMRPILSENDTLYISDYGRRSLLVYSRSGDYSWDYAYDVSFPATEEGFPFYSLTPTEAGFPIVYRVQDDSEKFPNGYSTVKLINRNGKVVQNTDLKFDVGKNLELSSGDMRISMRLSEMHGTQISPHPDGSYFQAWTEDPVLHQFSAEGDTLRSIELNGFPVQPVTSDAISSLTERYGGQFGSLENDLEEAIGDFFPAFSQMQVMKDHSIWLRKITPEVTSQSWYHLSPDGEPLGMLMLAEGESLRNSVTGHIYVSGEAEDGAPVILKYRISTQNAP
ncbi:6-bladed beta-propeller [Rhodohalobacter sp. 8-1]|uniref:6-bladed beta-propeller n=1 Tax=Rhodohalobacter sp. 8-1 TaxID=3131972 RepID=UPI0030EED688